MMHKLLLFLCIMIAVMQANAQKVALVLSGGGSKGTAHIGVIRALEENHVPIDYIAGTSIGAIIGGLYASGWSPDEMEKLVTSPEFLQWANGTIDEKYVYYFKQPEPDASWASFRFTADSIWKFDMPTNLVGSGQMDYIFMEIFSQSDAVCKGNFDSLFVPFRCIGANITDSRADVFRNGSLTQSVRASMTYPFYFKPITIDGKMYMDGGMYNNFPADVALSDFDPDIIIGSKVATENADPDPDNIVTQLENIFMTGTNYQLPCNSSVLIEPVIPVTNVIDFSNARQFIALGYDAAQKAIPEIRKFVLDSVSPLVVQERRVAFASRKPPLVFSAINVDGVNKSQQQYVQSFFGKFQRHDSVSSERMKSDYFRLLTDHAIKNIYPSALYKDSTDCFKLNLKVKKESNFLVRFGGLVSSNPVNEAFAEIQYKYLQRNAATIRANMYVGRFYSSGLVGLRLDFSGRPQYALFGRMVYNQWDYFRTTTRFFEDRNPSYLIINDYHFDGGVILPARNKGKITLSGSAMVIDDEYFGNNYFTRTDIPDRTRFNAWSLFADWERNTLNRKQYANKGTLLKFTGGYVSGSEKSTPGTTSPIADEYSAPHRWFYSQLIYENYFQRWGPFKLGWYSDLYFSNKDFFGNYTASMLFSSAFQPIPEMKTLFMPQFRAYQYGGAGLKTIFLIGKSLDVRAEGYIYQPYKAITTGPSDVYAVFGDPLEDRFYIASSSIVFHSPVGPVVLSLSYYDENADPFLLSFYFGYSLFNPRAIH